MTVKLGQIASPLCAWHEFPCLEKPCLLHAVTGRSQGSHSAKHRVSVQCIVFWHLSSGISKSCRRCSCCVPGTILSLWADSIHIATFSWHNNLTEWTLWIWKARPRMVDSFAQGGTPGRRQSSMLVHNSYGSAPLHLPFPRHLYQRITSPHPPSHEDDELERTSSRCFKSPLEADEGRTGLHIGQAPHSQSRSASWTCGSLLFGARYPC